MEKFIIGKNYFLDKDTQAFFHTDYVGKGKAGNPDYLYDLKNDLGYMADSVLSAAMVSLKDVLLIDFPALNNQLAIDFPSEEFTVCLIPRSKTETVFSGKQQRFKYTVNHVVDKTSFFKNGIDYIQRTINTRTTHRRIEVPSFNNDGRLPYKGITCDTCWFSPEIQGKNILLIDDIYTRTVDIVEDAIQALYDHGAKNIVFYAIGKTVYYG